MDSVPIQTAVRSRRALVLTQLGAGVLVGALALTWSVRGLDWHSVLSSLNTAQYAWVLVSFASVVGVAVVKTARWAALYSASEQRNTFGDLFTALLITQMVNVIIPIRVGELIRIGLMKQSGQPGATTLSTIAVEKTVDLVAAGVIAVSLVGLSVAPTWLQDWAGSVLVIGLGLIAGLIVVWCLKNWIERLLTRLLALGGWLPERWQVRLVRIAHTMLLAFGSLVDFSAIARVLLWTVMGWLLSLGSIATLFAAFGLQLSMAAAVVLMLSLSFSNIVPSPPALVGIIQAIAVVVLGGYSVAQSTALGFGIILNIVTVGPLILLGCLSLWQRAISLVQLFRDHSPRNLWRKT